MGNKKPSMSDNSVKQIVIACVILVLGILFCVSVAALDVINTIIGIGFIAVGAALLVVELIKTKGIATATGLMGGILIAFGIAIILLNWLGALATLLILAMMVVGAIFLVDSVLLIAVRNKKNVKGFVIELCIGAVTFTLGMCLWFIPEFREFANLVFGIILILYALYLIFDAATRKK